MGVMLCILSMFEEMLCNADSQNSMPVLNMLEVMFPSHALNTMKWHMTVGTDSTSSKLAPTQTQSVRRQEQARLTLLCLPQVSKKSATCLWGYDRPRPNSSHKCKWRADPKRPKEIQPDRTKQRNQKIGQVGKQITLIPITRTCLQDLLIIKTR